MDSSVKKKKKLINFFGSFVRFFLYYSPPFTFFTCLNNTFSKRYKESYKGCIFSNPPPHFFLPTILTIKEERANYEFEDFWKLARQQKGPFETKKKKNKNK